MKNLVKGTSVFIGVIFSIAFLYSPSWALSLSFAPSAASIEAGDSMAVDIVISGLENSNLAVFEFNIHYDNTVLASDDYILGGELGDLATGDAVDFSGGDLGGGIINLYELSWLANLPNQPNSFTLATVSFMGAGPGNSPLSFSNVILGDELGDPLSADLATGSLNVHAAAAVPEPATILLLAAGLASLAGFRKRLK